MPPTKQKPEKQEIASVDVADLAEVLVEPHEREAGLRKKIENLQADYNLLKSNAEEFQGDLITQRRQILQLQDDLVLARDEVAALKKKQLTGKFDKTIHLAGVPHKIFHQELAKEFMEDIKKRIVPEECICLAVVKA